MKVKLLLVLFLLLVLPAGWLIYALLLPDPILPSPLPIVTPEQAGLVWQECELPVQALPGVYPQESVICFGQPAPVLSEEDKANAGQYIDPSHVRLKVGEDVYEARANDWVLLTGYALYKNNSPVETLTGWGDTLWLRMFLLNVNGHIAWAIANQDLGAIVYDGRDLRNVYGLDKAHAAYGLAGKLVLVGQRGDRYFIVYDGQKVGPEFDRITIAYCCETSFYSARGGQGHYQFRGTRGGKQYIVDISAAPD